mgnify:CR=1 FL=1
MKMTVDNMRVIGDTLQSPQGFGLEPAILPRAGGGDVTIARVAELADALL